MLTGAGGGIGYEAARSLLRLGAKVIIAEIDKTKGKEAETLLNQEFGEGRAFYIHADIGEEKSVKKLANIALQHQLHEKVTHQRRDFLHKHSFNLSKEYNVIAVENLNIRSMLKNRNVSESISDAGWGMFRNMLVYKCEKQGGVLIKVEPQYTSLSSKRA